MILSNPTGAGEAVAPATGVAPTETQIVEAAMDDMEQLDALTLEDLAEPVRHLTFEHEGERPTDHEIEADVSKFLDAIRTP